MMRTLIFWSGLLGAFVAIQSLTAPDAYSQPEGKGRKERPPEAEKEEKGGPLSDRYFQQLTTHLNLSEAQQKKVKATLEASRPEVEKIEAEMKAVMTKMKAVMRRTNEAVRETLDLDQKEKFDEMAVHMKKAMEHHGRGGPMHERRERRVIEKRIEGPGGKFEAPEKGAPPRPGDDDDDDDEKE